VVGAKVVFRAVPAPLASSSSITPFTFGRYTTIMLVLVAWRWPIDHLFLRAYRALLQPLRPLRNLKIYMPKNYDILPSRQI